MTYLVTHKNVDCFDAKLAAGHKATGLRHSQTPCFSFIDEMLSGNSHATDIESLLNKLFESQVTEMAAKFQS